MTKLPDKISS